jgi:hypothetical protein
MYENSSVDFTSLLGGAVVNERDVSKEVIELHAQLRFAIREGRCEAENGKQWRESVFTDLLNRCDRLGIAIGIPAVEAESACQPQKRSVRERYVDVGKEWIGPELSVDELQRILCEFEFIFDSINGTVDLDEEQDLDKSLRIVFWALRKLAPTSSENQETASGNILNEINQKLTTIQKHFRIGENYQDRLITCPKCQQKHHWYDRHPCTMLGPYDLASLGSDSSTA